MLTVSLRGRLFNEVQFYRDVLLDKCLLVLILLMLGERGLDDQIASSSASFAPVDLAVKNAGDRQLC